MNPLSMLEMMVKSIDTDLTMEQMPTRNLLDKGINGPTSAHIIEQIHTPLNLAYVTFTTGSSAFQNIVGVTWQELPTRTAAGCKVFELADLKQGDSMLVSYPPLINVFSIDALKKSGIAHQFLYRSNRDAFLLALCQGNFNAILGESSFFRAALEQAIKLGLQDFLPKSLVILTAGTPLDLELVPLAEKFGYKVYDLYGSQEFGWLTVNGYPVRDDLSYVASTANSDYVEVVVGGLPTGDSFPVDKTQGHLLKLSNNELIGSLLTYKRIRTVPEYEIVVTATKCQSTELIERVCRTILRIKGRIVKVSKEVKLGSDKTELMLVPSIPVTDLIDETFTPIMITDITKTELFDDLIKAQQVFQSQAKNDSTWLKRR